MADKDDKKTIHVFFDSSSLKKVVAEIKEAGSSTGNALGGALTSKITSQLNRMMPTAMGIIKNMGGNSSTKAESVSGKTAQIMINSANLIVNKMNRIKGSVAGQTTLDSFGATKEETGDKKSSMGGKVGASIAAGVTGILGLVMSLKPMQAVMQVIGQIMSIFIMPLAIILIMMLIPFIQLAASFIQKINWQEVMRIGTTISNLISTGIKDIGKGISLIINGVVGLAKFVGSIPTRIITAFDKGIEAWKNALSNAWKSIVKGVSIFLTLIESAIKGFWNATVSIFKAIWHILSSVDKGIMSLVNFFSGGMKSVGSTFENALKNIFSGKFQGGGMVQNTGLALVHAGELVIPASAMRGSTHSVSNINMTVNANLNTKADASGLVDNIVKELQTKIRRVRSW